MPSYRIGVDVGGTFTDLALLNEETGEIYETKVLTTSPNPAEGCLRAINLALERSGVRGVDIQVIMHGTTIATNCLIERKGAKTALVTTRGFRDVLEIGRQIRPSLFDWFAEKPAPLVPRRWRYEVHERVKSDGTVVVCPDRDVIKKVARRLHKEGIESVAVSFLFSFLNRGNEALVADVLNQEAPGTTISISSQVLPEYREYERTSTVCANAYITPVLDRYADRIDESLSELGLADRLRLLQSNGGIGTIGALRDRWITTILSGPAGGVTASVYLGKLKQIRDFISMDIGGTSCDICLIKEYLHNWTVESSISGVPIRSPMIDVKSIGAGGGSVIWADSGGALRVGPRSTGSDPGPVCFGRGGVEPSITDAYLITGMVKPQSFADKGIQVDSKAAENALGLLGRRIGLSSKEVATGAIEVMNHSVTQSIRMQAMVKGYELARFSLVAFGGAGPLHACLVADLLGTRKIFLPDFPGVFSALGTALADYRYDFTQAHPAKMNEISAAEIEKVFGTLMEKAREKIKTFSGLPVRFDRSLDLRYLGQSFEINVPVDGEANAPVRTNEVLERFHRLHEETYGYCIRTEPVELVNSRISCFVFTPKPRLANGKGTTGGGFDLRPENILTPGEKIRDTYTVLDRGLLRPGDTIRGPCLLLSQNSTALVSKTWMGSVDEDGTIRLTKGGPE